MIQAALERGWWIVAVLVLVSSLLTMVYVWRVIEVAYFRSPADDAPAIAEAPATMLVPVWLLAAANVYFGINPGQTVGAAQRAAALLLGGA